MAVVTGSTSAWLGFQSKWGVSALPSYSALWMRKDVESLRWDQITTDMTIEVDFEAILVAQVAVQAESNRIV